MRFLRMKDRNLSNRSLTFEKYRVKKPVQGQTDLGVKVNPVIEACQKILDRNKIKPNEERSLTWFMDFGVKEDYPEAFTYDWNGKNPRILGYGVNLEVTVENIIYLMENIDFQVIEKEKVSGPGAPTNAT